MKIKDRIKQLRLELDLTQEQFAQKIGFSRTAISAWEIGRNEPSNDDTIKLANFFDVSTDYLLGKSDIRKPEEIEIDPDKIKIGLSKTEYGLPTKEQQDKIEEFARFILKDNLKKKEDK